MRFVNKQLTLILALAVTCNHSVLAERWSRQLSPDSSASVNDWVPIRNGKSVTFGDDLTPAAQTQFQFFAEPSNNRFNLQQTHPGHPAAAPSDINNFGAPNSPPPFHFLNNQKLRTVQTFGGPINKPNAEPLIQNPPPFQYMQEIQRGPHVHHYQTQPIPKTLQNFPQSQPVPNFQHLSGQSRLPLPPPPQFQPPPPTPPQFQPLQGAQSPQSDEQVQLLYVPFDSLYQQNPQQQNPPLREAFAADAKPNRFNILNQPVSASLINDFYSQNEVQEFPTKPATTKKPITTKRPTISPTTSSFNPTTPFETSTKPKPHQPPLSMFVAIDKFKGQATESDVLNTLKNSNSIDVMDSVTKNSPKVFIGPSGMPPPAGYKKFDLPYLSNIEGTRFERKIEQLPFFVAPLSYKTPPGFSKIPLPAPHVGSVVVNQPPNTIESNESNGFTQDNYFTKQQLSTNQPSFNSNNNNNNNNQKTQKITLTSGFNYGPNGSVQLIRNEYTFPTLSPTSGTSTSNENRLIPTTPRSTFAHTVSPSTAETPLTKVAYKQIEEQRNYGHSTHNPSTTRTPVTKTKLDHFPSSSRSTARATTTKAPFIELDEHKTVNEEYFGFEKEKKPTFSFKFGSEIDKPSQNFNFRPIPNFDFGDTDYLTTRKPKTKATTTQTQKSSSQYTFPSSTPNPTATFDFNPTISTNENSEVYGGSDGNFFEFRSTPRPSTEQTLNYNRFNFGNEQTFTQDTSYTPQQYAQEISDEIKEQPESIVDEQTTSTDNPNYNLPSELPAISAQLPEESTTTTTTTTTTRRPINRGSRRPVTSGNRSTATESTVERRPVTSRRRPTTYTSRNSAGTTEATFTSRSTASRGSKVKYNATGEDRSRFRTRARPTTIKKEEEIEYQRDVLNQNYPSSVRPVLDFTTEKLVESIHIQNEQVPTSNHVNDYNAPLESVEVIPLGVPTTQQAVTTTIPTTTVETTEVPATRRTNFPRRRLPYTTTDSPTTSDGESTEAYNSRTRGRKENVVVVKKIRGRARQTTTTTEAPETTRRSVAVRTRASYNTNRNVNRESSRDRGTDNDEEIKPRFRIRENTPRFRLDTQESQWSSRFNQNSFQPFDEEKLKNTKDDDVDDEQEIVTASSDNDKDSYLLNVSASILPTKSAEKADNIDETINMISTTEKDDVVVGKRIKNEDELGQSFEKFVKDVLEEIDGESKIEKKPLGNEKKTNNRRGVWKRVKVRPADAFETAETQNIGKHLYNAVTDNEKIEGVKQITTTAKTIEIEPTEISSTKETPFEHVFSETTTIEPEIDEVSKPGMFDEARKALNDFFSTEDDSDDAVNMEEADEKLEALRDSTTTQLPTTTEDLTTTVAPTVEVVTTKAESLVNASKQVKTSTSQRVTGEICYRGRCIKTVEK